MEPSNLPEFERIPLETEKPESGIITSVVRYKAGADLRTKGE